jgi:hypothetical protein
MVFDQAFLSKLTWAMVEDAAELKAMSSNDERAEYLAGRVADPLDTALPCPPWLEPFDGAIIKAGLVYFFKGYLMTSWPAA